MNINLMPKTNKISISLGYLNISKIIAIYGENRSMFITSDCDLYKYIKANSLNKPNNLSMHERLIFGE